MTREEKDKLNAWLREARATWNFIHWETRFEIVETQCEDTDTIQLKKVA